MILTNLQVNLQNTKTFKILFICIIAVISVLFLLTRLYNFENRYGFDHDQEESANAAWRIIVEKRPMLIGQETSVGGLFVGPFLYWFQSLGMYIGGLNPVSLGYQGVLVAFLGLIFLFLTTATLFNKKYAILTVFLYSISARIGGFDIFGNAFPYLIFFAILILWFQVKIFIQSKYRFLPALAFVSSLTLHVHFVLIFPVFSSVVIFFIQKPKIRISYYLVSLLLFLIPISTFLVFDLRHDFILFKNLIDFISAQNSLSPFQIFQIIQTESALLTEAVFVPTKYHILFFLVNIFLFVYFLRQKQTKQKNLFIILTPILLPLIGFSFYFGHVPEYYFLPALPAFLILTGYVYYQIKTKKSLFFGILLAIIVIYNLITFMESAVLPNTYSIKIRVVDSIIADSKGESFNVYYQMPPGINTGYSYLFKWRQREPEENGKNLYILEFKDPMEFRIQKYYKTYKDKKIDLKIIGFVHIVSVK